METTAKSQVNECPYAWIIDQDLIAEQGEKTAEGICGPGAAPDWRVKQLQKGQGTDFRLYDDDGVLCYTGRFSGEWGTENGFGPLDDFGAPNVGCTRIDYFNVISRAWVTL